MSDEQQQADAFRRATDAVTAEDLQLMPLPSQEMPGDLASFREIRAGELDNAAMAEHGLPGQTEASIASIGRITGYAREVARERLPDAGAGVVVMAGMVAHLFRDEGGVEQWIDQVFRKDFLASVGRIRDGGHNLVHAEEVEAGGFHGRSAALFAVHETPLGELGSTIVDFAVGRILGVAFVVTLGRAPNIELAVDLGLRLERRIVSVALGSA